MGTGVEIGGESLVHMYVVNHDMEYEYVLRLQ